MVYNQVVKHILNGVHLLYDIEYYRTPDGKEVIAEFLDSLPYKHQAKALWEIDILAEYGTQLTEPYVKHIDNDIWELRIKFSSDISRIFYFIASQNKIILLHGFLKKSNKTPIGEIEIAHKRMDEYKGRNL